MNTARPFVIADPRSVTPTMAHNSPYTTAVLLDHEQDVRRYATCPMCHTSTFLTYDTIEAGGDWRCVRCGQHWDARRLAAVAAYAAWVSVLNRADRSSAKGSHDAALCRVSATERPGRTP